jgi:hypothetical protein
VVEGVFQAIAVLARTGLFSASLSAEHRISAAVAQYRVAAPSAAPAVAHQVAQDGDRAGKASPPSIRR